MGGKPLEAGRAPLVDSESLKAVVRVLRVFQPLYRGLLQNLLLNICAHNESRATLVRILMDMLMFDTRKPVNDLNAPEPSYRLYACQDHVMYSLPQFFDGVPPLVSQRILETLTYLARNHLYVAKTLLQLKPSQPLMQMPDDLGRACGKGLMAVEEDEADGEHVKDGYLSIELLLRLLSQPLYLRSVAHLEQLLNLLEVIIDNADHKSVSSNGSMPFATEQSSDPQISASEAVISRDSGAIASIGMVASSKADDDSKPSTSGTNAECDLQTVLLNLLQAELQLLCSFLSQEGYGKKCMIKNSSCTVFILINS